MLLSIVEFVVHLAHEMLCYTLGISCSIPPTPVPTSSTKQGAGGRLGGGGGDRELVQFGREGVGGGGRGAETPPTLGGDAMIPLTSASSFPPSSSSSSPSAESSLIRKFPFLFSSTSSSLKPQSFCFLEPSESPSDPYTSSSSSHACDHCDSYVWHATSSLATTSLLLLAVATTLTMLKVVRSYSKKAERKSESSRAGSQQHLHSSNSQQQQAIGGSAGGGGQNSSSYYEEYRNGGAGGYGGSGNGHVVGANGQIMHHADNRHLQNAYQTHQQGGFSESSSYETREHFERKVQRVKKTRGERERSRSMRRDEVEFLDYLETSRALGSLEIDLEQFSFHLA
ncbi:Protein CBG15814 [Caenorhabditis briggsae]|uniref:Protein CBG15814 n=1 Tax=Caenorhabditis briggsae TaxID=6238 RepID=A8XMY8_CAEBR|nr:Protein CBG15814 [Caenorhabditis briggsae]CAP34013.1 Protein CBG15814 [Caenorhabditis briggsae]